MDKTKDLYASFHYNVAPLLFVVIFTVSTQFFAVLGTTDEGISWSIFGNGFSWKVVLAMLGWSYLSLVVPGKEYKGPPTNFDYVPVYNANGVMYYFVTLSTYIIFLMFYPEISIRITQNFPQILASCNICALALCSYLLYKGKHFPEAKEEKEPVPLMFEFYVGSELHPRTMGVDVKQLTNSRFGLMFWCLLVVSFFVCGWLRNGFIASFFVCVLLQVVYLGKFYWWETGYFNTLDIIMDRAGYYICWGCLVWVPCLYTFSSYYLTSHPPLVGNNGAIVTLIFGLFSIVMNYWVDYQKSHFRQYGKSCIIWGRMASAIPASYTTQKGSVRKTFLLASGFWGVARHMNYLFEIFVAISWSLPGVGHGVWPFIYPIFLSGLLIHRIFRDEKKCQEKYGEAWSVYCQKVRSRMIPGLF